MLQYKQLVVVGGRSVPLFAVSLVSGKPLWAGNLEMHDTPSDDIIKGNCGVYDH